MHRCRACHRLLTDPVSIKHGFGPECLKRAAEAGQAPLEALAELSAFQSSRRKARTAVGSKTKPPERQRGDTHTGDLFANIKAEALAELDQAANKLRTLGVTVEIKTIEH
jgi:hypothetical protein